jgi:hypothetical protein
MPSTTPTDEVVNRHIFFAKDLNLRLMNQEHLPSYQPHQRMGYADEDVSANSLPPGDQQSKKITAILKAAAALGVFARCPNDQPLQYAGSIEGTPGGRRGGGQIKKEIDGTKSKGASIRCAGTHKNNQRFCVREQRVPLNLRAIQRRLKQTIPTVAHNQWHRKGVLDIGYCTRSER